ncbi:MAG TPA: sigma-54 dependent transcriptional regulator [Candidatus Tectomicrobia bacterium]|nr:sigma-54 dependent transcriptional regulator [Candidatus Tectomicrobia bacterium]
MPHERILIVEDEPDLRQVFVEILTSEGYDISTAGDGEVAMQMLSEHNYDLSLIDLYLPKADGLQVLAHLQHVSSSTTAIVMTGHGSIESAVEAMKKGAADFITKPVAFEQLRIVVKKALEVRQLQQENRLLRHQLKTKYRFENLVGTSPGMQQVFQLIEKVADAESTVLILGESGTGKELVARAIHFNSHRAEKPLVPVNCGAIPESLLESELFGHERGAFTGAARTRMGRFELANGGTIFLDEVGDMSPALQVKLLRVLQDQTFERVGGTKSVRVDVRIIAATNRNLEEAVARGEFREDLYYRLSVIPLNLPPLRERKDDIPLLLQYFMEQFNRMRDRKLQGFSPHALHLLVNYQWPGNVRELENLVDRVVVLKGQGIIEPEDLPEKMRTAWTPAGPVTTVEIPDAGFCLDVAVRGFERELISRALLKAEGVKNRAAQLLGIKRTTLIEKLKRHSLLPPG